MDYLAITFLIETPVLRLKTEIFLGQGFSIGSSESDTRALILTSPFLRKLRRQGSWGRRIPKLKEGL